ncbi:hypothetical protein D3C87_2184000 [compost metagenome]
MLFDTYGMVGVFGLAAGMYAIFAFCIQLGPETYGMSMEDLDQPADADLAKAEPNQANVGMEVRT